MGTAPSREADKRDSKGWDGAVVGGCPRSREHSGSASPREDTDVSVHVGHLPTRKIISSLADDDPLDNPFLMDRMNLTGDSDRLLIVLVGLPARGKSIIAHKLKVFLNWRGTLAEVFSVGDARRSGGFIMQPGTGRSGHSVASFFNGDMAIAATVRELIASETLTRALDWLDDAKAASSPNAGKPRLSSDAPAGSRRRSRIAIFDATNSTPKRRTMLSQAAAERGVRIVFIESICAEMHVIKHNMLLKVRHSPDFDGMEEQAAIDDLTQRIDHYEAKYETLQPAEGAFIKLYDLNSKVSTNNIFGRMSKVVLPFLLAIHSFPRPISLLATPPDGSEEIPNFITDVLRMLSGATFRKSNKLCRSTARLQVCASKTTAATQLAAAIAADGSWPLEVVHVSALDAGGSGEGELQSGSNYSDWTRRLESTVLDLEAALQPVLVIAPPTPLRLLRAYLLGLELGPSLESDSSPGAVALDGSGESLLEFDMQPQGKAVERVAPLKSQTVKVGL